jgi:hypothetical protein
MEKYFAKVDAWGVGGNDKVWQYYEENKKSVQNIMKWDVLDLQHRLPARMLQVPYEILNRFNRNKLMDKAAGVAAEINWNDHFVSKNPDECIDFYFIGTK